ncbi:unnamed protein product [Rhodiola kirilowii]
MGMKSYFQKLLPFAAMVVAQCLFTGLKVISKAAMSQGMSHFVYVVYFTGLGFLLILPPHLFLDRKARPPITFSLLGKFFILSLTGLTLAQNFMFTGIKYSSPTLSSAISNLDPALTFLLAVIFRMEKVNIRCFRSHIKILGTLVSIIGALIMTLYRGPALWASLPSNALSASAVPQLSQPTANNWVFGGFCFAIVGLSNAASHILMASVLQEYPSVMTVVLFTNLFGTVQCSVISLIAERDSNAWKLQPDIELGAIVYGAVGGTAALGIIVWCIGKKGPVFVAMFCPLGVVIAALLSAIFLGDTLHVGSVVGGIIIVLGFYAVIWAKSKDEENYEKCTDHLPSSSSQKIPLLQDH